ncbi:hypothetical protein B0H19DRAFT_146574 [Mycena capillaripes]|nr:hypothetical protein B0H19DRAFT_146574 [Mycena capillaripes]
MNMLTKIDVSISLTSLAHCSMLCIIPPTVCRYSIQSVTLRVFNSRVRILDADSLALKYSHYSCGVAVLSLDSLEQATGQIHQLHMATRTVRFCAPQTFFGGFERVLDTTELVPWMLAASERNDQRCRYESHNNVAEVVALYYER